MKIHPKLLGTIINIIERYLEGQLPSNGELDCILSELDAAQQKFIATDIPANEIELLRSDRDSTAFFCEYARNGETHESDAKVLLHRLKRLQDERDWRVNMARSQKQLPQ